jgi:hypothetical protein
MCDIQIISGLAIASSGFYALFQGLSSYHWQIIVYLTWFSTVTHLAGLTVLRSYFTQPSTTASASSGHRKVHRAIRAFFMFALLCLLIAEMVPTQYFSWMYAPDRLYEEQENSPQPRDFAWCYYQVGFGREKTREADGSFGVKFKGISTAQAAAEGFISGVALISISFLTRMTTLFNIRWPKKLGKVLRHLRDKYDGMFERFYRSRWRREVRWKVLHWILSALRKGVVTQYLCLDLYFSLGDSMLSEVSTAPITLPTYYVYWRLMPAPDPLPHVLLRLGRPSSGTEQGSRRHGGRWVDVRPDPAARAACWTVGRNSRDLGTRGRRE